MQVVTSGAFSEVDSIVINYDFARILPQCNANSQTANTTVTVFYKAFGSVYASTLLDTRYKISNTQLTLNPLNAPGPLSLWFSCSIGGSAPVYDSNFGQNYNFDISGAVISFEPDFTNPITGVLLPGKTILVRYNVNRALAICPTLNNDPTLTVIGHYQMNNEAVQTWTVYNAYIEAGSDHYISSYSDGVIRSAEAGQLTLWFSCQSHRTSGWDSNLSRNYVFNT